jgi:hypothetical protein
MTVGNFWFTHFRHNGNTYRWYQPLFNPPLDLQEWQEIKVQDKLVCMLSDEYKQRFEGWEDGENLAYQTLSNFSELLGKKLSIEQVKKLLTEQEANS